MKKACIAFLAAAVIFIAANLLAEISSPNKPVNVKPSVKAGQIMKDIGLSENISPRSSAALVTLPPEYKGRGLRPEEGNIINALTKSERD